MSDKDTHLHESELVRSREVKTRGPYEFIYKQIYGVYPRAACYNIRELYIQCVLSTQCIREKRDFEACRREPECIAERMGLSQCRMMAISPSTRLRGNRWDQRDPEDMKEMLKNEKLKQRRRELGEDVDETHALLNATQTEIKAHNDTTQRALSGRGENPAPPQQPPV